MAKVAFAMAPQTAELADVTASVVKGTPRANVAVSVNERAVTKCARYFMERIKQASKWQ